MASVKGEQTMNPLSILTFLKSDLFKYILIIGFIVGGLYFVYSKGEEHIQIQWDAEKIKIAAEIKVLKDKADIITTVVETKYVERIKIVKQKGDTIYVKVPEYITQADNDRCVINLGAVRVWNAAIENNIPAPANETDRGPANISLAEVVANAATNFTTCNLYIEQNKGLKQWIVEQRKNNQ
jgi:hypothetical protein